MGRAIDQDNRLDDHERRLKLIEDALEEMIQTRVHHVDLTEDVTSETTSTVIKGTTLEPDEEYTAQSSASSSASFSKSLPSLATFS